jgi:hypothetical protein
MTHRPYQCALGRLQPNKTDPERTKMIGWRQEGILVVSADDTRLSWPEREFISQIATKLYGHRNKDGGRT